MLRRWHEAGHDTRWVMISYALWGIGEGLWMFIQPLYLKSLGATPTQTGFALGMWGVGRLLFMLPAGYLADRLGPRRVMLPGWIIGLTGVLIIALAPDWRWAAPGFLVYGISAIAIPTTNLYITQAVHFDSTRHPAMPLQASLTLMWTAYSLGIVLSPSLGGWIGDRVGLRAVYLLSVGWFLLSTLAIRRVGHYPVPERPAHGYDYAGMLRQRSIWLAFGIINLGFIAVLIGQALSSQYLEDVHAYSRTALGVLGSVSALGTAIFSLVLGRLSAWRGFFACLMLVLAAFGLLLLTGFWPVVTVAVFLLGAHYTTRPFATSVISERVSGHQRGLAYALVDTVSGLGTVVGTNTAGLLYAQSAGLPFGAGMASILTVAALGGLLLGRPRNRAAARSYSPVEPAGK